MNEIEKYLPHRPPFLFVDRITSLSKEKIIGYYQFHPSLVFFKGHFPEYPVVPGVLLVEAMAQCGGAGLRALDSISSGIFFLASVDRVKLRHQVRPGDELRMEISNLRVPPNPRMIRQKGVCYVENIKCAEAAWSCIIGEKEN